jgi:intein-encoded DNA endonuclease-like protein
MPIHRSVNKDFFKTWSAEMAYILGFFAADGNIIKNKRGAYFFSLEICDKEIVEKCRDLMKSNHKIGIRLAIGNHRTSYRLQIGSKEIYSDLKQLGFSDQKTHNISIPQVPEKYFSDFTRGYFDGDGNVWVGTIHKNRKKQTLVIQSVFTSCSLVFLQELKYRLEKQGVLGRITCEKTYYRLCYSVRSSVRLYELMYNNSAEKGFFLIRKKAVFEKFIENRNKMRL